MGSTLGPQAWARNLNLPSHKPQAEYILDDDARDLKKHAAPSQVLESRLASVEMSTLETKLGNVTADLRQAAQQSGELPFGTTQSPKN